MVTCLHPRPESNFYLPAMGQMATFLVLMSETLTFVMLGEPPGSCALDCFRAVAGGRRVAALYVPLGTEQGL